MAVDTIIEQIRQRVQANYPVATQDAVLEAETALGFSLPPLLKNLYLQVGNGGFGPIGGGLLGLRGGNEYLDETIVTMYATFRGWSEYKYFKDEQVFSPWPERLLLAFLCPCTIYICLDCSRPETPVYIYDTNFISSDNQYLPIPVIKHKDSFQEWLSAWMNGVDLWSEMETLTQAMADRLTEERRQA